MKVYINAGHAPFGKPDPGACGNGLEEWEVAKNIGARVEGYLNNIGIATRRMQNDSLGTVVNDANNWGADLFVSIHCNSASSSARGLETYYYEHSSKGKKFAELVQKQLLDELFTKANCDYWDRGIRTKIAGGYDAYVTKYTDMPAILVETAFISNPIDAKMLVDYEDNYARAIARGITDMQLAYGIA